MQIGYGQTGRLTNLRFADDILLIGRSLHHVRTMLRDLVQDAGKVGLEIHPGKTKILNNGIGKSRNT